MKRRNFLKKIAKLSSLAVLPTAMISDILSQSVEVKSTSTSFVRFVEWEIDPQTQTIHSHVIPAIPIQDFHAFLKDEWNSEEGMRKDSPFTIRTFGSEYRYVKVW